MQEDRNKEDCNFFLIIFFPQIEITRNFEAKSWHEHITVPPWMVRAPRNEYLFIYFVK